MSTALHRALSLLLMIASMSAIFGTLTGCGQTGPLYFDEDPPADQLPPSKKTPTKSVTPPPAL